jgi:iron complex outermembrane receptor protein
MEELVSEQDSYNLFIEHNIEAGGLKFHTEALVYRQDIPDIALAGTFVSNPAAWPLATQGPGAVQQNISGTNAYFVPGRNPAVRNLLNDLRNPDGSTAFTQAQIDSIVAGGRVGLQNFLWKPFGNGGGALDGDVDRQEGHLKMYRITEAIGGNLPEFWGTSLEWEIGLTYSYTSDVKQAQDILVGSMQAALDGFGGPNCTGNTPGANGCQYFNPFSSAIAGNVFTGATNPYYEAGLTNSRELIDWLYSPIEFERVYKNYVVDPIVRGDLGINLPGGPIAIAFGGQFRRQDERVSMDSMSNRNNNPCTDVGVQDCASTARIGPYLYNRQGNVFGAAANDYRPDARHYPVVAAFFETKLPLLDTLDLNIAGRYEKFFSDVTDIDNDVFVPAAALKWQPLDWLGVRTSWGKTFSQVNPPEERDPIVALSSGSTKYQGLGGAGASYNTNNYANVDVKPEKGDYLDLGLLFNFGNFSANIDYYDITIGDYTRQMTVANVLDALAVPNSGGQATAIDVNCSSGALTNSVSALNGNPLVQLPGPCVQGVTKMSDLIGGNVNYFAGVGQTNSGELKTNGIDFSARYRFDVGGGSITPSVDFSRVLKWELGDFVIGGVTVAQGYDGLGYLNLSSGRIATSVAKFRASAGLMFQFGSHMLNIQSQYVPAIWNEDLPLYTPANNKNANLGDANGISANGNVCTTPGGVATDVGSVPANAGEGQFATGTVTGPAGTVGLGSRGFCAANNAATLAGMKVKELINFDLIYRVGLPADTSATLTITNVMDKDPSFYRGIVPYNSAYGSPLGRTFKLGVTKRF